MAFDPKQVQAIFLQAAGADDRAEALDRLCGSDAELRSRVEGLLKAHDAASGFLDQPAGNLAATVDSPSKPANNAASPETSGTMIGPYKLLQKIGEGGMGTVWMAEQQDPVRRMVALKLVKAGMDSAKVVARFEAERQALALMDHPNIARIFDAGLAGVGNQESGIRNADSSLTPDSRHLTPSARPYFVMELVKGTPITKYCDEHRLSPRERLELFVGVCSAIQHAHQKGIIHRDIKPSNVLVAPYDGRPVVKVIDFGVAKATGQRLTDKTMYTEFGAVVGTLEYMSPEQAELNNQDIDTRSDIYALGVLLYELLTGSTPLNRKGLKEQAMLEMLRLVREQEPPKPSTRLVTDDALPSISAQRHMDPSKLTKLMKGELDWIAMKALDKDRNRRYETANGFGMDIQRYLAGDNVQACPPSAGYRFRKFLRKNRGAVVAASSVAVTLLGGFLVSSFGFYRAEIRRQQVEGAQRSAIENAVAADDARTKAEAALKAEAAKAKEASAIMQFFISTATGAQFKDVINGKIRDVPLSEALLHSEKTLAATFKDQPLVEANIRFFLGGGFLSLDKASDAMRQYDLAYTIRRGLLGKDAQETRQAMYSLQLACSAAGEPWRAESLIKELLASPGMPLDGFDRAELQAELAELYDEQSRHKDALPLWKQVVESGRKDADQLVELPQALYHLGRCQAKLGQLAEADASLRESLAGYEKQDEKDWLRFVVMGELGRNLLFQKRYPEAEGMLEKAYMELKAIEGNILALGPLAEGGRVEEIVESLIKLHEWTNQPDKAAEWRRKMPAEELPAPRVK